MSGKSGEKKRLEQSLLQMRAGNIIMVDPRFNRFQPEQIDTIRLRAAQIQAGKKPITERLQKQLKKTRKKARKTKVLRGETARNIREQRRFERGERRERDEDEPRIVGEPRNTGLAYDPDIERRRLDIQAQQLADANLRALMDRRAQAAAQERELAVRRGELAAARAERRLERERLAALPAPAPIVIPPAPAPNIRVEAPPPAQVRVDAPRVDVAPVINVPPPALPARGDADPLPEIQRLGAQIRADVDAFGQEQRQRNEDLFAQVRAQGQRQAELEARQGVIDEQQRQRLLDEDARLEEIQARLGMNQVEMGRARDAVIQEIRDAEGRLRQAAEELDRPVNYDDVILRAVDQAVQEGLEAGTPEALRRRVPIEEVEEGTPTPRPVQQQERVEPEPEEPSGIEGVIEGGGELQLPNVVVERPGSIEAGPDESLRLSPEQQRRAQRPVAELQQELEQLAGRSPRLQAQLEATQAQQEEAEIDEILEAEDPERARQFLAERQARLQEEEEIQASPPAGPPSPATTPSPLDLDIPEERLRRGGGSGTAAYSDTPPGTEGTGTTEEEFRLQEADPVNVADALRLSRLALGEAAPDLALEEADDPDVGPERARLRLADTQDFLAGFDAPAELQAARAAREQIGLGSPIRSPRTPRSPLPPILGGAAEADEALQALLAEQPPTPSPTPRARSPRRAGGQTPVQRVQAQLQREAEPEGDEPRPGQVAEGIAQFGGAARPAPPRVIEDAGVVEQQEPQRELRPLDPEVLLEPVAEAEEVGQVQDNRPQAIRDSVTLYGDALPDLAAYVRTGPQGARGQRGGVGYRIRNNTDRTLKKVQPGDVVNVIGVEAGARGEGRFRLDTETAAGTRVSTDQLGPLIEDGSFLFERGHRHELGGHFDAERYGPPPPEPGLLQQGAEAVGGAAAAAAPVVGEGLAAVAGAGARGLAGVAQGVGQGIYEQLPAAGDVGAALGRGAVAGVVGAGRLAAGAAGAVLGGGEEEEEEAEP